MAWTRTLGHRASCSLSRAKPESDTNSFALLFHALAGCPRSRGWQPPWDSPRRGAAAAGAAGRERGTEPRPWVRLVPAARSPRRLAQARRGGPGAPRGAPWGGPTKRRDIPPGWPPAGRSCLLIRLGQMPRIPETPGVTPQRVQAGSRRLVSEATACGQLPEKKWDSTPPPPRPNSPTWWRSAWKDPHFL